MSSDDEKDMRGEPSIARLERQNQAYDDSDEERAPLKTGRPADDNTESGDVSWLAPSRSFVRSLMSLLLIGRRRNGRTPTFETSN